MRVHTLTTLQMHEEIGRYTTVVDVSYPCDDTIVIGQCKKGRETVEQNMAADQKTAAQNRTNSQAAYNTAQGSLHNDLQSSVPGSLTPAATAQLAADRANIAQTYNGMRQTAATTMAQRGFGSAPSGFSATTNNSLDRGQEGSETGAYRNAQVNTQNQNNFATGEEASLAGQQGGLGNQASGESTNAAVDRSKMGSTAGDILGAVAQVAPIVAAPFTGGASLIPGAFAQLGRSSNRGQTGAGIGGYGSVTGG